MSEADTLEELIAQEALDEAKKNAAERETRRRAARAARLAPISGRLTSAGLEAIVDGREANTPSMAFLKMWLNDQVYPLMLLTGGVGCGKTMAASWALSRAPSGQYVHARQLGAQFQPSRRAVARGTEPLDMSVALLVVDDLGTEVRDQRVALAFSEILDSRQSADRLTIITTNLSEKDFKERYCERAGDLSRFESMACSINGGLEDLRAH